MKTNKIDILAELKDFDFQKTISFSLNYLQVKDTCLLAILLNEKLIDTLEICLDNISIFLQLSKDNESIYSLYNINKKVFKAMISKNSLEYMIHFFLKYYRDEIAEAEHIDIDFESKDKDLVTLTIKVESFKEYSSEEMNKLLGI